MYKDGHVCMLLACTRMKTRCAHTEMVSDLSAAGREVRLEGNNISTIEASAFSGLSSLR